MRTRVVLAGGAVAAVALVGQGTVAFAQEDTGGTTTQPEEKTSNPILPATNELIWGTLAFVILAVAMRYFAFGPVKQAMEARTERIRNNLDDAERVKGEAQGLLDDYQRQLADARGEAGHIIEEARQTADAMRRDLMARAEADAAAHRQKSESDIAAAQERAQGELRQRTAELAIELAEMIVQRSLDRDSQMQLVNSYIDQLQAQRAQAN
jgi:F-type H+-transporting ATPase subunit b